MVRITPKQQVLLLLDEALATGVRGRVATILKHAKSEILGEGRDNAFFEAATTDQRVDGCPGLVFKVAKHRKRWVYRYTSQGKRSTTQQTLGYFPQMDVTAAVAAWQQAREEKAISSDEQGSKPATYPVAQLVSDYLEYAQIHRPDWRREQRLLERSLVELYGQTPAEQVGPEEIELLLAGIQRQGQQRGRHGHRAAANALAIFTHLFDVARGRESKWPQGLGLDPARANPCEGITVSKVKSQGMPPLFSDLVLYQRSVDRLQVHADIKAILQWQLYLLVPLWALCRMNWQGVDWHKGMVEVEDIKGRKCYLVLDEKTQLQLRQRRQKSANSHWIFPALKDTSKPMPEHYPAQLLAALRRHHQMTDQFTATAIQALGKEQLLGKGRAEYSALIRGEGSSVNDAEIRRSLAIWREHLAMHRQFSQG